MRYLIFLTIVVFLSAQSKATAKQLLPGLLNLPVAEETVQLENCDYWFRDDAIYDLESLKGETCLLVEDADKGNDLAFAYWRILGDSGWSELSGSGPELWAYDRSRCIKATIGLFPENEPTSGNWADQGPFILWIRVQKMKTCDA